mmetsp:Transcript_28656/g.54879  ORF Transcript_28656/g.54879 Transcript_28656/m.54879 type:complete len:119 (-) Transcript_28656:1434-1790(-)
MDPAIIFCSTPVVLTSTNLREVSASLARSIEGSSFEVTDVETPDAWAAFLVGDTDLAWLLSVPDPPIELLCIDGAESSEPPLLLRDRLPTRAEDTRRFCLARWPRLKGALLGMVPPSS